MSVIERTDVLVVGAGAIGASCAFHLTRRGLSVVVVDTGPAAGHGSTGRATGGFRATYGTEINVRLSLLAAERLRAFPRETGVDPEFHPVGYLWLAGPRLMGPLEAAVQLQRRSGLSSSRVVTVAEAHAHNPVVSLHGVAGGVFCSTDGVMRPMKILWGYLEAAMRGGAQVHFGETVESVVRDTGGRITEVQTSRQLYQPAVVINAAGPWAQEVAGLCGVSVPVTPQRRQVAITAQTTAVPPTTPLTIWADDGFHFRERDGRVLLLAPWDEPGEHPFDVSVDPRWLTEVQHRARARVPALADVPVDADVCWAGLYEMSPDHHALLGRAEACPNLVLVNGSSGHGVMHAPALGLLAAELVADGAPRSLDVSALRPSRFDEGQPITGPAFL